MAAAPPVRPPSASMGKPGPGVSSIKAEMATVMANLANLFAMDRDGKLTPTQVVQLRQLIAAQSRQITLRMTLKQQTNPLLTLSPHLDPTVASGGNQAIISKDIFNTGIKFAEQEAQRVLSAVIPMPELKKLLDVPQDKRNQELANDAALRYRFHTSVLWYTKGGADAWVMGPRGAVHVPPAPAQPASGAATPSNATSQGPVQPISHPNANAKQQVKGKPAAKPNTTTSASPAAIAGGTNATDSSSSTPAGTSVKTESDTNPLAGIPRQPPVAGDSQPQAGISSTGSAVHPALSAPPAQSAVPRPPPVYVEPESTRRKRKLKEFLQEESPGMEYEYGVVEIWNEVVDSFLQEAARGAVRLAKHRSSGRVGVKDMAMFLNMTYGITVPGFNAAIPEKVRVPVDQKKRTGVTPRAARLPRAKEEST